MDRKAPQKVGEESAVGTFGDERSTLEVLADTARLSQQTIEVGDETTDQLQQQTETIERSDRKVDYMEYHFKVADRFIRGISSFSGAVRNWFSCEPTPPAPIPAAPPPPATSTKKEKENEKELKSSSSIKCSGSTSGSSGFFGLLHHRWQQQQEQPLADDEGTCTAEGISSNDVGIRRKDSEKATGTTTTASTPSPNASDDPSERLRSWMISPNQKKNSAPAGSPPRRDVSVQQQGQQQRERDTGRCWSDSSGDDDDEEEARHRQEMRNQEENRKKKERVVAEDRLLNILAGDATRMKEQAQVQNELIAHHNAALESLGAKTEAVDTHSRSSTKQIKRLL